MATPSELKVSVDRFIDETEPRARAIVNGADNETVTTDIGEIKTFAKAIADFENLDKSPRVDISQTFNDTEKEQWWNNIGVPSYSDLTAANTALEHNVLFYNTTSNVIQMTTV